jgi:uncharacterized protein (TIGR03083 family)
MTEGQSNDELGRAWGYTASDAFHASAEYFRTLPDDAWGGPTGCADWDERTLSGHILGEAVWFPNTLRGVIAGEPAHPAELYEEMKSWSPDRQADRLEKAADEVRSAIDDAIPAHTDDIVDVAWAKVPLWQATYVMLMEGVYHNWDTRAGSDPAATIPTPWAVELAKGVTFSAPLVAHHGAVAAASGRYHIDVADGAEPLTILTRDGALTAERGLHGTPDVVLYLTADQCVRLVAGRFSLVDAVESGRVRVAGDNGRIAEVQAIFGGIANE